MIVRTFNPLEDPRWDKFVRMHPRSSVFHTTPWLEALRRTYDYSPIVYTCSPPDQDVRDALLFCRVDSWLTGRRLVSLPFSDHCELLVNDCDGFDALFMCLLEDSERQNCGYVEIRPIKQINERLREWKVIETYCLHCVDLAPDIDTLFHNCHKSSTQRKIHRAERERLECGEGRSEALLNDFCYLLLLTRRRHGVPPQPRAWFQNLMRCFGESLTIRVAYHHKRPIAAIMTLRHKDTLVYKFGCSDVAFHGVGGMQFLLWRSIIEAKKGGLRNYDLGRSNSANHGLITFKDRLGATRSNLAYLEYHQADHHSWRIRLSDADWKLRLARRAAAITPGGCLSAVGKLLYRHIG
jgi:hypothetical protein